ncbi:MAG: hypothetical protein L7W94_11230 [Alphaproteobacteria bacterium]|jgi:hypothetical protein|nr:hypothetical protein [Alphaproteobacteria bacterium]
MARKRRHRSLGEMISTISFYGVGIYFLLEGTLVREEGGPAMKYATIWLAGVACLLGGARFMIADLFEQLRGRK